MIFGVDTDEDGEYEDYRLPTVREIASFMSFPIHYQFEASTESKKFRLVGNAVPCKMAGGIAQAIADEEGMDVPEEPYSDVNEVTEPNNELTGREWERREPRKRRDDSKYYRHIPYMKIRGFRVEIDNKKSDFSEDEVVWSTVLHKGQGRGALKAEPSMQDIEELMESKIVYEGFGHDFDNLEVDWEAFKEDVKQEFSGRLPDAETFQEVYVHRGEGDGVGPHETLETIREIIDEHLPQEQYEEIEIPNEGIVNMNVDEIPIRIVAGMFACKHVTETVMEGGNLSLVRQ
jgi:DNA (cytosine-5)-methyltransferase 1